MDGTDGRTDGRMVTDGWMNRWIDGWILNVFKGLYLLIPNYLTNIFKP